MLLPASQDGFRPLVQAAQDERRYADRGRLVTFPSFFLYSPLHDEAIQPTSMLLTTSCFTFKLLNQNNITHRQKGHRQPYHR